MKPYVSGDSEGFSQEEFADIKMCLETLLSVRAGSQPLDRDLGIDYESAVALPINVAKNRLSVEIIGKCERYEPRIQVEKVEFDADGQEGKLIPRVYFIKRKRHL